LEAAVQHGRDRSPSAEVTPPGVNTNVPHSARIYDYWLGGKDNFAVDRAVGEAMIKAIPGMRYMAAENRKFVGAGPGAGFGVAPGRASGEARGGVLLGGPGLQTLMVLD
jgi:S-adenosyl methyltransferase